MTDIDDYTTAPPTMDAQLGKRLQQARKAWGWSQKKLADHLLIDPSSVSRMEGGHQMIPLALAVKIAEALGISVLELTRPPSAGADVRESLAQMQSCVGAARETLAQALTSVSRSASELERVSEYTRREIIGNANVRDYLTDRVARAARDRGCAAAVPDPDTAAWLETLVAPIADRIVHDDPA